MKKACVTVLCSVLALASCNAYAGTAYVNSRNGVSIRSEPSTGSDVLCVLPFRSEVEVGKKKDGWYKAECEDKEGYVNAEYVQDYDPVSDMEYCGEWRITAYAETGYPCANGQYPTVGYTVACNSLPFGAEIYIEGVGFRTVEDRGPGWLGDNWCDLYLGITYDCVQWGDQYRNVYISKRSG